MKYLHVLLIALILSNLCSSVNAAQPTKPNIIFILADDAGIGDFSAYGCKYGKTPNIDRLASEGMRFTSAYSGNAVCAPSRCSLMTGLHPGHAAVRANAMASSDNYQALPAGQATVAQVLHDAGYATGGFGKWGLGNVGEISVPEKVGFDVFFGYYDQGKAHNYFPDSLLRNSVEVPLHQSGKNTWDDYSATRIATETISFIEQNKDRPFFCYAAWTLPHKNYVIPNNAPYGGESWTQTTKNYAAMVGLVDKDVGRVMQKLKELHLDDNTLVIFASDNGANKEFITPLGSTGGYRGFKRMLYEGGIRTPFIARWPSKIAPSTTSDVLTTFIDFLPTASAVAGTAAPKGIDGISILPTLLGQPQTEKHEQLYFEIYEPIFQQSLRMGNWKGYRKGTADPLELYDLKTDPKEETNLAAQHPGTVKQIEDAMAKAHTPSPHYDTPAHGGKRKGKNAAGDTGASLQDLIGDVK